MLNNLGPRFRPKASDNNKSPELRSDLMACEISRWKLMGPRRRNATLKMGRKANDRHSRKQQMSPADDEDEYILSQAWNRGHVLE